MQRANSMFNHLYLNFMRSAAGAGAARPGEGAVSEAAAEIYDTCEALEKANEQVDAGASQELRGRWALCKVELLHLVT